MANHVPRLRMNGCVLISARLYLQFSVIPVYTSSFCTGSLLVQTSSVYQYIGLDRLVQFVDSNSWYYMVQYSFALDPVPVCTVARLVQMIRVDVGIPDRVGNLKSYHKTSDIQVL
jgi:hypothetical protein